MSAQWPCSSKHKKICCVLFFKVKTWIFYVHVIYMNLCCFYFIHCTCLVTSQMFVPAAHSCMLHRFKSLESGVVYIKWRFWKQITLTFFLVSGHYWVIVFICLENWRGWFISVWSSFISLNLTCLVTNKWAVINKCKN